VDLGLEPACVVVCPEHAILAGDLDDPKSEVSRVLAKQPVTARKPEQGTAPKLFYVEGNDFAMHPTAPPPPRTFMFSDVRGAEHASPMGSGRPALMLSANAAERMVQVGWNARHDIPWHWPIPAYLVTKATAGGLFLALGSIAVTGPSEPSVPLVCGGGLALTLFAVTIGLLLYDLERPERFVFLFTRPQWRSWVARAAWILSAFGALGGAWWGMEVLAWLGALDADRLGPLRIALALPVLPLALMAGIYTAFLFAQAEGRDFWQSQVTPVHMALQTVYLGAIAGLAVGGDEALRPVAAVALVGSLATLLLGEFGTTRANEIASRAQADIQWGAWRAHFWAGGVLLGHAVPLALLFPARMPLDWLALGAAAAGLFAYAYAFIMAPQHIPNS
jgi:formate-dependent nitrite reductase membrane component NrfD